MPAATKPSFLVKLISPKKTMLKIFNLGRLYLSANSKERKADNKKRPSKESLYWLVYKMIPKGKAVTNTAASREEISLPVNSIMPKSSIPAVNRAMRMLLNIGRF